jgi:hypothetical protein
MGTVKNAAGEEYQTHASLAEGRGGWLTPVLRRRLSIPRRVAVATRTYIILCPKNWEARHPLNDFGTDRESETKEERVHEGIAKAHSPRDNIAGRKLERTTEHDKALAGGMGLLRNLGDGAKMLPTGRIRTTDDDATAE